MNTALIFAESIYVVIMKFMKKKKKENKQTNKRNAGLLFSRKQSIQGIHLY